MYKNLRWKIQKNMWEEDSCPNQAKKWNNIVVDCIVNTRTPYLDIEMFMADNFHNQRTLLKITLWIQDPNGLSIENEPQR